MSIHQLLRNAAQAAPSAIAIRYQGRDCTWSLFVNRVAQRAAQLRSSSLPSARVALLAANLPEHMEADYAVLWADRVLVPLNTRLSLMEQQFILEHSECELLCFDERSAKRAAELMSRLSSLRGVALAPIAAWDTPQDALTGIEALPFTPAQAETAAIFYTGGTTGIPKGVALSHTALLLQAMSAKDNYRLDEGTVFVHSAPMFHLADFAAALGTTAGIGAHSFLPEYSPSAFLDCIEQEGVNVGILVPPMIPGVLDAASSRPGVMGRLRTILYGAAPIQEPILCRLMQAAPGVGLVQVYGQTEVGGACTALAAERHVFTGPLAGKLGSAGRVVPAFTMRIANESGEPCANGVAGEVQVSGPGLMTSYWKAPALTALAMQDGWLRTGDVGVMDDDGFVSIVGRLKDMIISGGENVFAGEVESALMYHDAVAACAVFGVPDAKWGEAVHAAVVLKPGCEVGAEELIAHCRTRIAHYKCPRGISLRHQPLPLSGVGKVRKVDLLDQWKREHPEGVSA